MREDSQSSHSKASKASRAATRSGITCVVHTQNHSINTIGQCLESLKANRTTTAEWDLVVLAESSLQNEIESRWTSNDWCIPITIQEKQGRSGLDLQTVLAIVESSPYSGVSFIDANMLVSADWIEEAHRLIEERVDAGALIVHPQALINPDRPVWFSSDLERLLLGGHLIRHKNFPWRCGLIVRTAAIQHLRDNKFDFAGKAEGFAQLALLCLLRLAGWHLSYPDSLALERVIAKEEITKRHCLQQATWQGESDAQLQPLFQAFGDKTKAEELGLAAQQNIKSSIVKLLKSWEFRLDLYSQCLQSYWIKYLSKIFFAQEAYNQRLQQARQFKEAARANRKKYFLEPHKEEAFACASASLHRVSASASASENLQEQGSPLCAFVPIRNELKRLPGFLEHYRRLGVERFFFIDNDSTDGSAQFLTAQPDVVLYHSSQPYSQSLCGKLWQEALAARHAKEGWHLFLDVDEFLIYPHWRIVRLQELCQYLDQNNERSFRTVMLDMYADGFPEVTDDGKSLWEIFPYFDAQNTLRERVFDVSPSLRKSPLRRFDPYLRHTNIHWVDKESNPSTTGALLHFKFDSTFPERVVEESERKEHYRSAIQYKKYANALGEKPNLSLFDKAKSIKFENDEQLVRLDIMQTSSAFDEFARLFEKTETRTNGGI